jgi:hypothetical protein
MTSEFGNELKHELPTAEVGLDPSGGGYIGSGCHRCRSLHSGIGSASRRMGARRQRANRAHRRHRRIAWGSCWRSFCTHCHFDIAGGAEPSGQCEHYLSAPLVGSER